MFGVNIESSNQIILQTTQTKIKEELFRDGTLINSDLLSSILVENMVDYLMRRVSINKTNTTFFLSQSTHHTMRNFYGTAKQIFKKMLFTKSSLNNSGSKIPKIIMK